MAELQKLDFSDLKVIEERIPIGDQEYILREGSAGAVKSFRAMMTGNIKYGPNGRAQSIDGKALGAESQVVGSSLFLVKKHKDIGDETVSKSPIGQEFIINLPNRVQEALFERFKEFTPTLYSNKPDTPEELKKQIEKLQAKLEKLQEKESQLKNS